MDWLTGLLSIGININYDSGNRTTTRGRGEGGTDAQRAAAERARAIGGYRRSTNAGTKYKPNAEDKELIGVTDAILFWASESGVDNSTDDAGNSGLHLTLFDTTTRADSAQIKLLNDSGSTQYVVAAAIKAKPIIRMSGDQGFTHDAFIDYQDIFLSGENTFEFGNNFVVTKAQLEQLADYYAKALGTIATSGPKAKHIYAVSIPGRCWWFEPGEWYTLQVGGAGQREYIDSVVECYDVTVDAAAGDLGTTNIAFREVEQNWVKDSNAVARFLATGDPRWKPNNFGRVVVAAKDYLGVADYYCDGTADQTEIQAAIDYLASAFGGGMVELTEGQFNITAAIEMETNIILRGAGARTIIEKNCNDYAIEIVGGNGTEKENTKIWDLSVTRNTADTNTISLIYLSYADYANIDSLLLHDGYGGGIEIVYCDNLTISKTEIKDCRGSGVNISFCSSGIVVECRANNCHIYGIAITSDGDNFLVSNCISENNWQYGIMGCGKNISIENNIVRTNGATGIQVIPGQDLKGNNIIRGNIVENNGDNTNSAWSLSVANGMGIFIDNLFSEGNIVNSNYSKDNGNLIVNGACE
jgi:hypothetical protein